MLNKILMTVCVLALTLAAFGVNTDSASAGGQWVPVFDETLVASVTVGDSVLVAMPSLQALLEAHTGENAVITQLGAVIAAAPQATSANQFRIYGGFASGNAASTLEAKGFDTSVVLSSDMAGVDYVSVHTD